jgi:opacity protein-like surface antigen
MNRVIRLTLPVALVALLSLPATAQRPGPGRLTAGILGGVTFPTGDFKDEVSTGWHAGGLIKMRAYGALDIRLDGAYAKFGRKEFPDSVRTYSTDAKVTFGTLNALINLGPDSAAYPEDKTNSPYLLAGLGRYRLDYQVGCVEAVEGGSACRSGLQAKTYTGVNIGAGVTVPFFAGIRTFVETRYHRISRPLEEGGARGMFLLSAGVKIR